MITWPKPLGALTAAGPPTPRCGPGPASPSSGASARPACCSPPSGTRRRSSWSRARPASASPAWCTRRRAPLAAAGGRVLTGLCHPLREPYPYGPVVDALRRAGPLAARRRRRAAAAPARWRRCCPIWPTGCPGPATGRRRPRPTALPAGPGLRSFLTAIGPAVLVDRGRALGRRGHPRTAPAAHPRHARAAQPGAHLPRRGPAGGRIGPRPGLPAPARDQRRRDPPRPRPESDVRHWPPTRSAARPRPSWAPSCTSRSEGLPLVAEEDLITAAERGPGEARAPSAPPRSWSGPRCPRGLREASPSGWKRCRRAPGRSSRPPPCSPCPPRSSCSRRSPGWSRPQGAGGAHRGAAGFACSAETRSGRYDFRHVLAQQVAYWQHPRPAAQPASTGAPSRSWRRSTPPPLVQIAHHTLAAGDHRPGSSAPRPPSTRRSRWGTTARRRTAAPDPGPARAWPDDLRSRAALALAAIARQRRRLHRQRRAPAAHPRRPAAAGRRPAARSGCRSAC